MPISDSLEIDIQFIDNDSKQWLEALKQRFEAIDESIFNLSITSERAKKSLASLSFEIPDSPAKGSTEVNDSFDWGVWFEDYFQKVADHITEEFKNTDQLMTDIIGRGDFTSIFTASAQSFTGGLGDKLDSFQKGLFEGPDALFSDIGMFGSVLQNLPLGGLLSSGLNLGVKQVTDKLFGKKDPQPVVVINAAEIADRIESRVSVTGIDPLARERGDYRFVSEGYALDELMREERNGILQWVHQMEGYVNQNIDSPAKKSQMAEDLRALREMLLEGLEEHYSQYVDQVVADFDRIGEAVGMEGADLAANVQLVLDGLKASQTIQGKTAEEIQDKYKQEYEQSKAAAKALKELNDVMAELESAAAELHGAFDEAYRSLDPPTIRSLTGSLTEAIAGLRDLSGPDYADGILRIKDLLMERHALEEQAIRDEIAGRRTAIEALWDGHQGLIDGVWVNIQGLIPSIRESFATVLADFDTAAGAIAELLQGRDQTMWDLGRARWSVVQGYEEKNPAEMIPELLREMDALEGNSAFSFERRRGMLGELQSTIMEAYRGTFIGRDEALSRLGDLETSYNSLYDEELAKRRGEIESGIGGLLDNRLLLSGAGNETFGQRYGLSLDNYDLGDSDSLSQLRTDVALAQDSYLAELQKERDLRLLELEEEEKSLLEAQAADTRGLLQFFERIGADRLNTAIDQLGEVIDAALSGENRVVQLILDGRDIYSNQKQHLLEDSASGGIRADDDGQLVGH